MSEPKPSNLSAPNPRSSSDLWDAVILGAGAAGLMTAIVAARRGKRVLLLDHAKKPAEKIRISGGGRCNFTNIGTTEKNFLSHNPRFCISALRTFKPKNFIAMVEAHGIAWHEKTLGQLFCDDSAQQIIDMLLAELRQAGGTLRLETVIKGVEKRGDLFVIETNKGTQQAHSLVVATGGKSIPKMGATGLGYDIAQQFNVPIIPTRAALVPFTFSDAQKSWSDPMAGLSVDARVCVGKKSFREGLLFTHRGLSGPSILQISSYWQEGVPVIIDLAPDANCFDTLAVARQEHPKQDVATILSSILPKRLAKAVCERDHIHGHIAQLGDKALRKLDDAVHRWTVTPIGTEGYRTAEVTLGGVDTKAISSKTMQANETPGLYFIGEVLDVTGHLGGFNFQWAWASGYAAGNAL
ncbi:NAD(P)/FAD-dependent oxidoreductase [Cohaesibacter celericrescens]|uniref:Aminoacetone oxidase family FAD-binding enzyme n=1 Tax=Cohaesibacter celericrescens TaxID=2067669 RepID=A0A2N5XUH6_9HYPH|nr:NAD(P)/FAD-dependent oxidoreductase [Cohaesibacter celericrescens]PLW78163.1 aminoacetone oxidase family FAD-binding enzyme [Cohaesibacter celericrescens]